jgi:hypothetical protein
MPLLSGADRLSYWSTTPKPRRYRYLHLTYILCSLHDNTRSLRPGRIPGIAPYDNFARTPPLQEPNPSSVDYNHPPTKTSKPVSCTLRCRSSRAYRPKACWPLSYTASRTSQHRSELGCHAREELRHNLECDVTIYLSAKRSCGQLRWSTR